MLGRLLSVFLLVNFSLAGATPSRSEKGPPFFTSSNAQTDTSPHRDIFTELEHVIESYDDTPTTTNGTTDSEKISRLITELQTYKQRQNRMLGAMSIMFGTHKKHQNPGESLGISSVNDWKKAGKDNGSTSVLHKLVARDTSYAAKQSGKTAAQEKFSAPSTNTPTCPSIDTDTQSITWYGYENNADCSWLVTVPTGQVVSLTIRALSLEEDINCAFDYLKLTDLFIQTSATLCGVLRPNDVCRLVSVGGSVRITFHSDDSITAGGFVVSYIAIQPGSDVTNCALMGQHDDGGTAVTVENGDNATPPTLSPDDTTPTSWSPDTCPDPVTDIAFIDGEITYLTRIVSPGFPGTYGNNLNCSWNISADEGQALALYIDELMLEANPKCTYDHLQITDPHANATQYEPFCGIKPFGALCRVVSLGSNLIINFVTDSSISYLGFVLLAQTVAPGSVQTSCESLISGDFGGEPYVCETSTSTASIGTITSPLFPMSYPNNADCRWIIRVDELLRVSLLVRMLSLEPGFDVLVIAGIEDEPDGLMLSGEVYNLRLVSVANIVALEMHTDVSITFTGFEINYMAFARWEAVPYTPAHTDFLCGRSSPMPAVGRIVGGHEAGLYDWPWMLGLYADGSLFCGASILSRYWAMTASHCLIPVASLNITLYVIAGDHTLRHYDGLEQTVEVEEAIVYPGYDPENYANDVALLRLKQPLYFNQNVRPVCVVENDPPMDSHCVSIGWGTTQGTANETVLNEVQLPLIHTEICNQTGWLNGTVQDNMFCAGREGVDTCQGDSGGPFLCRLGDVWAQVGTVSWGYGCGVDHQPGLYGRLSLFTEWINETTSGAVGFI